MKQIFIAGAALALIVSPAQALETDELLSLVAMPLAVHAVAEMAEVPEQELLELVSLLNEADVRPAQFVETVRYLPVALLAESEQPLTDYVRLQVEDGVRGEMLVERIEDRYTTYGLEDVHLVVTAPRVMPTERAFIPDAVRRRVADHRAHPHGGPPGQVKKEIGVQTGAEVVHGRHPSESRERAERREPDVVGTITGTRDDERGRVSRGKGSRPDTPLSVAPDEVRKGKGHGKKGNAGGNRGDAGGKGNGKGKGKQ